MCPQNTRQPWASAPSGVYFVTGADLVKIGITRGGWRSSMAGRLFSLQTGSPVPLRLHRFIACPDPQTVENWLHARFAAERHHGEWFEASILEEIGRLSDEQLISDAEPGAQGHLF